MKSKEITLDGRRLKRITLDNAVLWEKDVKKYVYFFDEDGFANFDEIRMSIGSPVNSLEIDFMLESFGQNAQFFGNIIQCYHGSRAAYNIIFKDNGTYTASSRAAVTTQTRYKILTEIKGSSLRSYIDGNMFVNYSLSASEFTNSTSFNLGKHRVWLYGLRINEQPINIENLHGFAPSGTIRKYELDAANNPIINSEITL